MIICKLCGKEFKKNRGACLTKHLMIEHNITRKEYCVITEYGGKIPKCKCGLCDEEAYFHDNKRFGKYAKGHNTSSWYHTRYKELYNPTCLKCGKELNGKKGRKEFPMFCSLKCSGDYNKQTIISKMRPKIIERYKTDPSYRNKISKGVRKSIKEDINGSYSRRNATMRTPEHRKRASRQMKKQWKNQEYRNNQMEQLKKIRQTPEFSKKMSDNMKNRWRNPVTRPKMYNAIFNNNFRYSKLHLRIREELELDSLGFIGEQRINTLRVDELNMDKKLIIEINGDYVHANPKKYNAFDEIRLPGSSYLAKEKWEKDKNRTEYLESLGYTVLILWESDNLYDFKEKLIKLLNN